jgi:myo-inositol-1(or 4)-monophosphatase
MKFSKPTEAAIEVAKKAGRLLKSGFTTNYKISNKEGIQNLVTEYDFKSEKLIIKELKKKYPKSSFLAEEEGQVGVDSKEIKWIIDPLDGTVNFAHRIPFFCVSIGAEQNGEIILGVIYNPIAEELFVAEKNKGAYLGKKKIQVSNTKEMEKAFLATGFPYNLKDNPENCIDRSLAFLKMGLPLRRLGSAALDMAYVACGRYDGFWETSLGPWDCAAGKIMVEEAKGKITNWEGCPFKLSAYNTLVASNGKLHNEMLKILKKHA